MADLKRDPYILDAWRLKDRVTHMFKRGIMICRRKDHDRGMIISRAGETKRERK